MSKKILIVEDERKLAHLLQDYLVANGFECTCLYTGDDVIDSIKHNQFDFLLLDVMLPGKDGFTLCREIRQFSMLPIIMLTAKIEEIDRLLGLELGADDYICKPYSPREVIARVKAVLRRSEMVQSAQAYNGIGVDEKKMQVTWQGHDLALTAVEYNLFTTLFRHPGQIFQRSALMNNMYSDNRVVSERSIDSHIKKLRKKILAATNGIDWIRSVYGVGYKFEPEMAE